MFSWTENQVSNVTAEANYTVKTEQSTCQQV